MAINNTEIEIKIPVSAQTFTRIRGILQKNATFIKSSAQSDEYFIPTHHNFLFPEFPFEWLSIRKRGTASLLNYKHWYPENTPNTTYCDEFETEVKDSAALKRIFSVLDIKPLVTVEKERETFLHKDEFEIALDTVKELGYFIEIETIKDFGSIDEALKRLNDFAHSIGLDAEKTDTHGYPLRLLEKKGLIKR